MTAGIDAMRAELEKRWVALPAVSDRGAASVDLPTKTAFGPVLLGRTALGRCLFVPFPPDKQTGFAGDRRSRAVHLDKRPLGGADGQRWYAELVCLDTDLDAVFTTLCVDLLMRLENDTSDPVVVTLQVLQTWRALFASGGRLLTVRQLGGLYGELLVLQRILHLGGSAATTWRGPFRERHDFLSGTTAIEVKTMLAADGHTFRVHGAEQLTPPVNGRLALAALHVDMAGENGQTVPELAGLLRDIGGMPVARALTAAGYRDSDAEAYARHRFELKAQDWYIVDGAFPRITPASFPGCEMPTGISEVDYTVDFDQTSPDTMSADEIALLLQDFA